MTTDRFSSAAAPTALLTEDGAHDLADGSASTRRSRRRPAGRLALAFALTAGALSIGSATPSAMAVGTGHQAQRLPRCTDAHLTSRHHGHHGLTRDQRAAVRAIDRVDWLAGDWVGQGWAAGEGGAVATYTQHEVIRRPGIADVMVVDGRATSPADPSQVLFTAHATLTRDPAKKSLLWVASSGGHTTSVPFTVTKRGWRWSVDYGNGVSMRYTTTTDRSGQTWHEVGEITQDGTSWTTVMSMDLVKTCDAGRRR